MATILVVDDAAANAQLIKVAMETSGYVVLVAHTAEDGLNMVEHHRPDLVVLDLRLPGSDFDGWTFLEILRENPGYRHLPVLVTSVEVTDEDRPRAFDAGCDAYFAKPFSIGELRNAIRDYIGTP